MTPKERKIAEKKIETLHREVFKVDDAGELIGYNGVAIVNRLMAGEELIVRRPSGRLIIDTSKVPEMPATGRAMVFISVACRVRKADVMESVLRMMGFII